MPALQIRDLPQGTYDSLKLRAEREHRSMAQQATVAIEEHLRMVPRDADAVRHVSEEETRQERIARRKAIFERIDRLMEDVEHRDGFPDVVEIVREGREERDDRLGS